MNSPGVNIQPLLRPSRSSPSSMPQPGERQNVQGPQRDPGIDLDRIPITAGAGHRRKGAGWESQVFDCETIGHCHGSAGGTAPNVLEDRKNQ